MTIPIMYNLAQHSDEYVQAYSLLIVLAPMSLYGCICISLTIQNIRQSSFRRHVPYTKDLTQDYSLVHVLLTAGNVAGAFHNTTPCILTRFPIHTNNEVSTKIPSFTTLET